MSDETNSLLRQILDAQTKLFALQQREADRAADFRNTVMQTQQAARRRQIIAVVIALAALAIVYAIPKG